MEPPTPLPDASDAPAAASVPDAPPHTGAGVDPAQHHSERESDVLGVMSEFSNVFAFMRARSARYARELHPDLKGSSMLLLHCIMRNEPITATTLGQYLEMDKAIVSRQLASLRALQLVTAEPDPQDRRSVLVRCTPLAQERIGVLRQRMREDYRTNFGEWDDEEITQFRRSLSRFNNSEEQVQFRRERQERDRERQEQQRESNDAAPQGTPAA